MTYEEEAVNPFESTMGNEREKEKGRAGKSDGSGIANTVPSREYCVLIVIYL